ncbi:MAG: hypothetical protein ABII74_02840 [Elusimicrobiota bacterium]
MSSIKNILGIIFIIIFCLLLSKLLTQVSPFLSIALVVGLAVCLLGFLRPDLALIILIVSMIFSPELKLAELPGRDIVIRMDDIILILVILSWLVRITVYKELGLISLTPLNKPIFFYISICFISSALAMINGNVNWIKGTFYLLRYLGYFLLFFMVSNVVQSEKQIKLYLIVGLITCLIMTVYVYSQFGSMERVTAPFEGKSGEPNTLGGYYIIVIALVFGFFAYNSSKGANFLLIALLLFLIPPFIRTLSRASYVAFVPMLLTLIFFTRRKKLLLVVFTVIGIIILPLLSKELYQEMRDRVLYTFSGTSSEAISVFEKKIDSSAGARLESWKNMIYVKFPQRSLLGWGVTGAGFLDGQYPLVLGETGVVGLIAFIWLLWSILKNLYLFYRNIEVYWLKGFALGMLSATAGLIVHAIPSNTFIIIRIMEPFWFLLGMIMAARKLYLYPLPLNTITPNPTIPHQEGGSFYTARS